MDQLSLSYLLVKNLIFPPPPLQVLIKLLSLLFFPLIEIPQLKLLKNFYRFQQREKRRNELFELKRAFEADKDRVAKLKASRKFKPM